MAIAIVQTVPKPVAANTDDVNVGSETVPWGVATGTAHLLVMVVINNSFVPTISTRPTGYSISDEFVDSTNGVGYVGIYHRPSSAGSDANPSASWTPSGDTSACIYELSGTDTTAAVLDAHGNTGANATNTNTLAITTAAAMTAGERFAIACVRTGTNDGGNVAFTNSFVADKQGSGGAIGHRPSFTATAATLSTTASWPNNALRIGAIAVYRAASGGLISVWDGSAWVKKPLQANLPPFTTKPLLTFKGGSFQPTSRKRGGLWVPERYAA